MMRVASSCFVFLALGCSAPSQGARDVAPLDRATFDARVEPVLVDRCATAECHGSSQRGLELYAPLEHRADPERVWLLEPLTEAELRHNFEASVVFARVEAWTGGPMLLRKPLADAIGEHHGGGAVFASDADRDWRALRDWVEGVTAPP